MSTKFKKAFCEEGCGRETRDPSGVCFNCRRGIRGRQQSSGYLGNEEMQHREDLPDVWRNMKDGWPYSDNGG